MQVLLVKKTVILTFFRILCWFNEPNKQKCDYIFYYPLYKYESRTTASWPEELLDMGVLLLVCVLKSNHSKDSFGICEVFLFISDNRMDMLNPLMWMLYMRYAFLCAVTQRIRLNCCWWFSPCKVRMSNVYVLQVFQKFL